MLCRWQNSFPAWNDITEEQCLKVNFTDQVCLTGRYQFCSPNTDVVTDISDLVGEVCTVLMRVAAVTSQLGTVVYPATLAILTQICMHHVSQPYRN